MSAVERRRASRRIRRDLRALYEERCGGPESAYLRVMIWAHDVRSLGLESASVLAVSRRTGLDRGTLGLLRRAAGIPPFRARSVDAMAEGATRARRLREEEARAHRRAQIAEIAERRRHRRGSWA